MTCVTHALHRGGAPFIFPFMHTARARLRTIVAFAALGAAVAAAPACRGGDGVRAPDTATAAAPEPVPVPVRADSLAHAVVRLIARGDADSLARLATLPPFPPEATAARAAIAAYARHFDGAPVTRIERVRTAMEDTTALRPGYAHLVYRLSAPNGRDKLLAVSYDARTDHLHPHDELLGYAWQANGYANAITAALRAGDAMRLARHLSVDDIDYPVELARRVIARYREHIGLPTLGLRAEGLAPERPPSDDAVDLSRPFVFTLLGTKDGRPVEHAVRVVHGDGLVGWDDPWVPRAPGQ